MHTHLRRAAGLCASILLFGTVSAAEVPSPYRLLDPANTLYMELESGRVVIELAPTFAPNHVANIKALVKAQYFDKQRINRVQDNFVTQWGDGNIGGAIGDAKRSLPGEFTRSAQGLPFVALPDPDTYAPQTGFVEGFPAARDSATGNAWLVHCYGMVGVGRGDGSDSGSGMELYAVNGHSPRQLDRNITVVGRVVQGMDLLAMLPRGKGASGFYETPAEHTVIKSVRLASEVPEAERIPLEALRVDSAEFAKNVESRRNREDTWYKVKAGRIEVCNVPLNVRRVRE